MPGFQQAASELLDESGHIDDGVNALPDGIPGLEDDDAPVEAETPKEAPEETPEDDPESTNKDEPKLEGNKDEEEDFFEIPSEEEGGEPTRIAAKDVLAGYQKATGLEQEVTELRQKAQTMPEEMDQALQGTIADRSKYIQGLQVMQQMIQPVEPNRALIDPNSPNYNPDEYGYQLQEFEAQRQQYASRSAEIARVQNDQSHQVQQLESARAVREQAKIREFWPELKDDTTAMEVQTDLAQHYGIDTETLKTVKDSRFYALAKDALAHRKAMAAQTQSAKIVRGKPKLVRGHARGNPNQQRQTSAMKRFNQSGSMDDAIDALSDDVFG